MWLRLLYTHLVAAAMFFQSATADLTGQIRRNCSIGRRSDRPCSCMSDHRSPTSATRPAIVRSVNVCGPTLAAFELLPRARRGHRRARLRAHGVGRGERRAVAVAAGVDEDAPAAVGLAELLREALRIALDEKRADGVCEPRRPRRSRPCRRAATTMWNPFEPDVFTQLVRPSSARRSRSASAAARSTSGSSSDGIEVEDADVGVVQVRRARRPHVRRDAVLVGEPEQRSRVADERMVHRAALLRNLDALQPLGETLRDVLLQEALLADAGRDSAPS